MLINKTSQHGGDIYKSGVAVLLDFSANVNAFGAPPSVVDAVRGISVDDIVRYPDPYCTRLRRALAQMYGITDIDRILCGNGASDLIYAFSFALAKESSSKPALVVSPTFGEYEAALCAACVPVEHYDMSAGDIFALTRDILRLDLERYCAVFICSPNNPTGHVVDVDIIEEISSRCHRLFLDACFLSLSDAYDKYDIALLSERHRSLCVLDAFTKSHGIAGMRLGWCVCSDAELLSAMSEMSPCWNVSAAAQSAGVAAANEREWLSRTREKLWHEREYMAEALSDMGIFVYPGRANYLLLRAPMPLYEMLLYRHSILVRDCGNYRGLDGSFVRVAVRTHGENMQLIDAIRTLV